MASLSSTSRSALLFIFLTMLVDTIGLGITIPVAPKLIVSLTDVDLSTAARYGSWLFFCYALMQFLFAPVIGNLSDRFGRRPVLITSLTVLGIDYVITGLAPTIGWLFVGRLASGMAGAAYSTANAYIADVSTPEKRAANFGLIGAAFGIGFVLGPALGGVIGQYFGPRTPFLVAAGLAFANALFGYFVLRESLPPERRRPFDIRRANPMGALLQLRRYPILLAMIVVFVLMRLAHDANPAVWSYYTMLKFGWSEAQVGLSLAFIGVCMAAVFGGLTRVVVPRIGESGAVYAGTLLAALGFVGYAFATAGWQLYVFIVPFAMLGLASPAVTAIMSKNVPASEQGELQGTLASVGSLTSVVAPVVMANLFAHYTSASASVYFPGAAFLAAASCMVLAAVVFSLSAARRRTAPTD
ncbi:MAG: TCR/Tet family MFS transporter [Steroidobacteraceae bacterium]|nr:TCR/Tet family MFS transporter [Steroidobacteraceae bacterium]